MAHRFNRGRVFWSFLIMAFTIGWVVPGAAQGPPPQPGQPAPQGQPPTGTGMFAGRVLDADSGEGVAGATVTMTPRGGRGGNTVFVMMASGVLTDSQGRFVFSQLPATQFSVNAQREGYASVGGLRMIDAAEGSRISDYVFRIQKLNTIAGTVRDDTGDPVVGTDVLAFRRIGQFGRPPAFLMLARSRTNDRGEYRLSRLPAGQYWICACTRDAIPFDSQLLTTLATRPLDLLPVARRAAVAGANVASLDTTLWTYAPTFYPDTQLASRAERITVEKGETRSSVDIAVATARAVRVSGQVIGLPPSSISAGSLRLVPVGDIPEAAAITMLPPMLVQPDGRFDFAGVPPGTYTLEMNTVVGSAADAPTGSALSFLGSRRGPPPPPPPPIPPGGVLPPQDIRWATETVVVGDGDVIGIVVAAQPGITVRGKIEFAGSAALPPPGRGVIQLLALEQRAGRPDFYGAQLGQDMTFTFVVPPGRYTVPLTPSFPSWSNLKSITARGVDVRDTPFVVEGDVPDLVITMSDTPRPSILGTADLPRDEVPEEWYALSFPSDRRLWKEPAAAVGRFSSEPLNAQRTFGVSLPPGDYFVALSKGIYLPNWIEASRLEELAKTATSVTLVEGDKKSVQVRR